MATKKTTTEAPKTTIEVKERILGISEAAAFVKLATEICFDPEGKYIPIMNEIKFFYTALAFYTDFDPISKGVDEVYKLYYNADSTSLRALLEAAKEEPFDDFTRQLHDMIWLVYDEIHKRMIASKEPETFSEAVMAYLNGKSSPAIAGLIETVNSVMAESANAEAVKS